MKGGMDVEEKTLPNLNEVEEQVKYYEMKLQDLQMKSKKSRKLYQAVIISFFIIAVCGAIVTIFASKTEVFLNFIDTISIPILILLCTRAYTVYLISDQLIYECRDKLFNNFVELKKIRPLTFEETKLYMSLFENL